MIPNRGSGGGFFVLRKINGQYDAATLLRGGGSCASSRPSLLSVAGGFLRAMLPILCLILIVLAAITFSHHGVDRSALLGAGGMSGVIVGETQQDAVKLVKDLHIAFDAFKKSNDERFDEIKAKGYASADVLNNVEKSNKAITDIGEQLKTVQAVIKEMETAQARAAAMQTGSPEAVALEAKHAKSFLALTREKPVDALTPGDLEVYRAYKVALTAYLRRGDAIQDSSIRNALQSGQAPAGGYWLTPDLGGRMVEFLYQTSPVRQVASQQSIGTDTLEGAQDLDEADSGWVGETDARSETNTPLVPAPWKIPVYEQYANPKTTQKLLDDAQFDVEGWLAKKVADKLSRRENTAFVLGNTAAKPRGFMTYAAGKPGSTIATWQKIEQLTTGAAGAFSAANPGDKLIDVIHAMKQPLRVGALWAMNNLTVAEVRKLKDGEGRYLLIPDFSNEGVTNRLLGYGIIEMQDIADMAANSLSIAFANWKEAYQIVDHTVGIRTLRDPFTAKPYIQFYTTKRVGGGVLNFEAIKILKFA